jgi:hypothetical protein
MSATSKRTLSAPARSASWRAALMNRGAASTPSTSPSGPTTSAIRRDASPKPQPMSSTARPASAGGAKRLLAVLPQPGKDQVTEPAEAIEQDPVPGFNRLLVGGDD